MRWIAGAALVATMGCATPYQPAGYRGGYEDFQIPGRPGVIYLSFSGNGFTSRARVTQLWYQRAQELCPGGYDVLESEADTSRDIVASGGQVNTVARARMEGYIRCTEPSSTPAAQSVLSARLYDLDTGEALEATFEDSGQGRGAISMRAASGGACNGEYVTVPSGSTTWGSIFKSMDRSDSVVTELQNEQRGRAIITCPGGRVIECEYVTSFPTRGYGACIDNAERRYRVMF